MNIHEVVNTVKNFEEDYKRGYYAYELSAHNVSFKRQSDPDTLYVYFLYDYNREYSNTCSIEKIKEFSDEKDVYYYGDDTFVNLSDLEGIDDFYLTSGVDRPYAAMLHIKSIDNIMVPKTIFRNGSYYNDFRENKISNITLNSLKYFLMQAEYQKEYKDLRASFAGIGYNDYNKAEFHINGLEYRFSNSKDVNHENRNRKHFGYKEYLFPYKSNNIPEYDVLYIQNSTLNIYRGERLKKYKEKSVQTIKDLMAFINLSEDQYDLIEINKLYKGPRL